MRLRELHVGVQRQPETRQMDTKRVRRLVYGWEPSATASGVSEVPGTSETAPTVPYGTLWIDPPVYGTLRYLIYNRSET